MQETQVESLGQEDPLEKVKVKSLSRVRLFASPWAVAYHASPSMGFPRQEYWSELPFPSQFFLLPGKSHGQRSLVGYSP